MVMLPNEYTQGAFNPATGGGKTLVPNDAYKALIVGSEMKATSNGRGQYLQLTIVVADGQYKGSEFIERLNLVNDSEKAREIASRRLDAICAALGFDKRPSNSNDLHGKHFIIETETKKGDSWTDDNGVEREGSDYSEIKKFLRVPSSGQSQQQAPVANSGTASNPFVQNQQNAQATPANHQPPF